jgi:hypothetical protein
MKSGGDTDPSRVGASIDPASCALARTTVGKQMTALSLGPDADLALA